jgi:hypothetical protein
MLAREDLVTDLNNQLVTLVVEPPPMWFAFAAAFFRVA